MEADLPGFEKEEITVELEEYAVTIKADRSVEREEKGEKFYRRERQYGKVERTIPLPAEVTGKSKATYRNGVLTITLEKKHPTLTSRKTITIE